MFEKKERSYRSNKYSNLSHDKLDALVKSKFSDSPNVNERMMRYELRRHGMKVMCLLPIINKQAKTERGKLSHDVWVRSS